MQDAEVATDSIGLSPASASWQSPRHMLLFAEKANNLEKGEDAIRHSIFQDLQELINEVITDMCSSRTDANTSCSQSKMFSLLMGF